MYSHHVALNMQVAYFVLQFHNHIEAFLTLFPLTICIYNLLLRTI